MLKCFPQGPNDESILTEILICLHSTHQWQCYCHRFFISNTFTSEIGTIIYTFTVPLKVRHLGAVSIYRPSYLRMAISMLKIRRPLGRLIFNMGIAIPGKTVFLIETAPWMKYIALYVWLASQQWFYFLSENCPSICADSHRLASFSW